MDENLYFADGQINDEVFVTGSFLQSKMAKAGVTCSNCHNPHSGKIKFEGNGLCAQCHLPDEYDTPKHHFHKGDLAHQNTEPLNTTAVQCVDCHMPARTYMQVDDRRDHSFVIPNAQVSANTGSPNACLNCHASQDLDWVDIQLKSWQKDKPVASENRWTNIHQLDDAQQQYEFAEEVFNGQAPIVQAKLLSIMNQRPDRAAIDTAFEQLNSRSPLVRRSAIGVLAQLPPQESFRQINTLLFDPVKSVRFAATGAMVNWLPQLPDNIVATIAFAIEEYKEILLLNADSPSCLLYTSPSPRDA